MGLEGPPVRRRRRMGREPVGRGKKCPEARLSWGVKRTYAKIYSGQNGKDGCAE